MAKDIRLPNLGEGVKSAQVTTILISVGDSVVVDQGLIEMETDKASMEIPSTAAGTITAIHVDQGQDAKPGDIIVSIDEAAAAPTEPAPEPKKEEPVVKVAATAPAAAASKKKNKKKAAAPEEAPAAEPEPVKQ